MINKCLMRESFEQAIAYEILFCFLSKSDVTVILTVDLQRPFGSKRLFYD